MTVNRRRALKWGLGLAAIAIGGQQAWRHGHDYIFPDQFAVVEPGAIYRGAWQKPWPMRQIIRDRKIKTIVALAHPPGHPLAQSEKALSEEMGVNWVHIPIVDERVKIDGKTITEQLDAAADVVADPANQPVFFHCHHGLNRASMVQIAYRIKHCGWTLEQATAEIDQTFGLIETSRGADYRFMEQYAKDRLVREDKRDSDVKATAVR